MYLLCVNIYLLVPTWLCCQAPLTLSRLVHCPCTSYLVEGIVARSLSSRDRSVPTHGLVVHAVSSWKVVWATVWSRRLLSPRIPMTSKKDGSGPDSNGAPPQAIRKEVPKPPPSKGPIPPDGGWGWMVVFASFMIHVVSKYLVFHILYILASFSYI